jgi:branched-chain amino acid transport system substrate-binding protein
MRSVHLYVCVALAGTVQAAAPGSADVTEVLIGYFGPASASHPVAGDMWCAASLAVEQANAAGGYGGIPFRLVPGWSENPWGTGVSDVARMAYVHKVWAVIGGIDGPSTHLAEQVVAKARLTLVNPAATDKSVNQASVPWMFSCVPQDHVQAAVLAPAIASNVQAKPFVMVSTVDHDSHLFVVELLKALKDRGLAPAFHFELEARQPPFPSVLEKLLGINPQAVVLIADARNSARMLSTLRAGGYQGAVFGGPWMGSRAFIEQAGNGGDGIICPFLCATSAAPRKFEQDFAERFGRQPDYLAAHTYDATTMTIAAIRRGGLDRTRIRDALKDISPWQGVSGEIRWDTTGANARPVSLGIVRGGRVYPLVQPTPARER